MPVPSSSGFGLKEAVPWLLSAGSLMWNYINFKATQKLKARDRDWDEWKMERNAIVQALRSFEDALDLLQALQSGRHGLEELNAEIEKINLTIVTTHGKLTREIERAQEMKAPLGAAYGMEVEGETAWDRLNTHLAEAAALDDASQVRARLASVRACGQEIRRSVEAACRDRPRT